MQRGLVGELPRTPLPALRWIGSDRNTNPGPLREAGGRTVGSGGGQQPSRTSGIPPDRRRTPSSLPRRRRPTGWSAASGLLPRRSVTIGRGVLTGSLRVGTGGGRARCAHLFHLYRISGASEAEAGRRRLAASRPPGAPRPPPPFGSGHGGPWGRGSSGRLLPRSGAEEISINLDMGGTGFSAGSPKGPCPSCLGADRGRLGPGRRLQKVIRPVIV